MLVTTIERKLWREVARLKGQIATIALVLAAGISSFVGLRGATVSLEAAREAYYDRYRFAHVFARAERAPEGLRLRVEALPGVALCETRVSEEVTLPLEGMARPAYGRLLSLPSGGEPAINAVALRAGRLPSRGRDDEVALLATFAERNGLRPGDRLPAVINGKLRRLRVVGLVLSPEFVYALRPGAIAEDPKRYAVLWMDRAALASAFQLEGSFNDLSLRLQPGASDAAVRAGLDRLLAPYGGDGAVDRAHQGSNRILSDELNQLGAIAGMVPLIFLGVAAFLINMVLGRLVALQRPTIATLKALGYTNREIGWHFLGLVAVVLAPGAALGLVGGLWLGRLLLGLYGDIFHLPDLDFRLSAGLVATALLASAAAAVAGALLAIRAAVALPPAQAMRPPAPSRYRRGLLDRLGVARLAGPVGMMILREVSRRPLRTALSSFGMAGAIALIILGNFGRDSIDSHLEGSVLRQQRQDLAVSFLRPLPGRAVAELARLPGVLTAEGLRGVPVRVRFDQRSRDTAIVGIAEVSTLRRVIERDGADVPLPPDGVLATKVLGDVLGFRLGDRVEVEVREGDRRVVRPVVVGFVDEAVGVQLYASAGFVASLEGDLGAASGALLAVDPARAAAVEERLRRSPHVLDVSSLRSDIEHLREMNGAAMDVWSLISAALASCVIFGVVYNNARVSLATRSRDLASLRVLGMSRGEISTILIGGLAVEMLLALPLGLLLGRVWSQFFMNNVDQEAFRWTVSITPRTYAYAAAVALVSAAASALWVRRSLDRLDLIGVLKTRE